MVCFQPPNSSHYFLPFDRFTKVILCLDLREWKPISNFLTLFSAIIDQAFRAILTTLLLSLNKLFLSHCVDILIHYKPNNSKMILIFPSSTQTSDILAIFQKFVCNWQKEKMRWKCMPKVKDIPLIPSQWCYKPFMCITLGENGIYSSESRRTIVANKNLKHLMLYNLVCPWLHSLTPTWTKTCLWFF